MLPSFHSYADTVFTHLIGRTPLYSDGFGSFSELDSIVEYLDSYNSSRPPSEISITWEPAQTFSRRANVTMGSFESPFAEYLPVESKTAYIELIQPRLDSHSNFPICLLLAATAEQGFWLRRRFAVSLLKHNIGSLILENPYYGKRRPHDQRGAALRTVRDQFAMNTATVEEARSLLHWLNDNEYKKVGVSGYSQGGIMAAFAAGLTSFPIAAVPRGAGNAADPVFTSGCLSKCFAWNKLSKPFGNRQKAESHFRKCLKPVIISRYPMPTNTKSAIILGGRFDKFIPNDEVLALHEHWKGSELRWLDAGHISSIVTHRAAHQNAVLDAFKRLV